jgi:hypothetical protein
MHGTLGVRSLVRPPPSLYQGDANRSAGSAREPPGPRVELAGTAAGYKIGVAGGLQAKVIVQTVRQVRFLRFRARSVCADWLATVLKSDLR